MEIIGPLLLSLLAGLSTLIGGAFIFFKIKRVEEFINFCLSFSMTIMMIVSIFDLIPNSLPNLINKYNLLLGIILLIIVFILGYLLVDILNDKIKKDNNSNLYKIGLLSMISLMLHNFPEGIAVFISAYANINIGSKLCIAIMLHNIPEGISIAVPLYYSGKSRWNAFLMTLISGLAEPLGALLSYLFLKNIISNLFLSYILIFVSGLMISLSINDIYKEIKNKKSMISGILFGTILYLLLFFIK